MKLSKTAATITTLALTMSIATGAQAAFIHNVGGTDYQWMEFSSTLGQSRVDVEAQTLDSGSALYGYRYATSTEVQALLESYTTTGLAEARYTTYAAGINAFFTDFGTLTSQDIGSVATNQVANGDATTYDFSELVDSYFYYGDSNECDNSAWTCLGRVKGYALSGTVTAFDVEYNYGWDISGGWQNTSASTPFVLPTASLLIKDVSAVPVPAAAWLFASGLLGLIGVARRKKT